MAEVDFPDLQSVQAWFETQSVEVRCAMSSRAALRVMANFSLYSVPDFNQVALPMFRSLLTSAGRGAGLPNDVDWDTAARSTTFAVRSALSALSDHYTARSNNSALSAESTYSAISSIASAANSADSAAISIQSAASSATFADSSIAPDYHPSDGSAGTSTESAAQSDHLMLRKIDTLGLYLHSVWGDVKVPEVIRRNHTSFLERLASDPKWAFWHDWYLAMWRGGFDNWDLAFEVIKIDNAVWEAGAEAVAAEVERIQAKLAVKNFIDDLRNQSKLDKASRHSVGGNNPPEPISDTSLNRSVTLIWASIDALEQEAEKTQPSIAVVEAESQSLKSGLAALLKWVGGKADLAVDSAIKWGIPAGAGYIVLNPDKISTLLELVKYWLQLLH